MGCQGRRLVMMTELETSLEQSLRPSVQPAEESGEGAGLDISVILPVYEEAGTVKILVPEIIRVMVDEGWSFEILAVDDGSGEVTRRALEKLASEHRQHLTVIRHMVNRGNGAALRSGIRVARGAVVVTMDADGQHAPEHIPDLLREIPPYDLVIGARTAGYRGPWHRNLANRFYNLFSSWLSQRRIEDLTSGLRAMRREVVLHFLPLFPEGFSAPTTTTLSFLKAGYSVKFVPVDVGRRAAGESKISLWKDGARFVTLIMRMIMLYDPLRIFLPTGVFLLGLGSLAWIAGIWTAGRLVFPNSTIFLYSAAITTWLLGLISDQIASTRVHYYGDEALQIVDPDEKGA